MVHCEDVLVRAGLTALLGENVGTRATFSLPDSAMIAAPCSTLLVFPESGQHADRFRCLERMSFIRAGGPPSLGVAVVRMPIDRMLALRLVESGFSHVLDYDEVAVGHRLLLDLRDALEERHRLPTAAKLRQQLRLRPGGNMAEFCAALERFPAEAFVGNGKQSRLPITRRQVQQVRRLARDTAGMPPPPTEAFSTAHRNPPTTPAWGRAREMVQRLWGLRTDPEAMLG
jgi:hypothetical protein